MIPQSGGMRRFQRSLYVFNIIFLGLLFFTAGMAKLFPGHRFPGLMGPVWLEDRLLEYGLGGFARFIAHAQVVIGYLLITWRYRWLGSLMLAPMLLNILAITISQDWRGTPWVVGFFLMQLTYVFWVDRRQYLHLVIADAAAPESVSVRKNSAWLLMVGLGLVMLSIGLSRVSVEAGWAVCAVGLGAGVVSVVWIRTNPVEKA